MQTMKDKSRIRYPQAPPSFLNASFPHGHFLRDIGRFNKRMVGWQAVSGEHSRRP
jgi:hypothetical protein